MAPLSSAAGENGGLTEEERERERDDGKDCLQIATPTSSQVKCSCSLLQLVLLFL